MNRVCVIFLWGKDCFFVFFNGKVKVCVCVFFLNCLLFIFFLGGVVCVLFFLMFKLFFFWGVACICEKCK